MDLLLVSVATKLATFATVSKLWLSVPWIDGAIRSIEVGGADAATTAAYVIDITGALTVPHAVRRSLRAPAEPRVGVSASGAL